MKWLCLLIFSARAVCADFAFDLYRELRSEETNWIFSPLSISACLSMAAAGAKGETAKEFASLIDPAKVEEQIASLRQIPSLRIVQGAWVKDDSPLLPDFVAHLRNAFDAVVEQVPFTPATAWCINNWVALHTNQKIQNLIPPSALDSLAQLVFVNALYFQGAWKFPFHTPMPRPFYLASGKAIDVPTLQQTALLKYFENEDLKAVALPAEQAVCLLVLPKTADPFTTTPLAHILSSLSLAKVHLAVPKFTLEQRFDLKTALETLGLCTAFTPSADFSGIDGRGALVLHAILHKTFFSFDENGIEAAAATTAVIRATTVIHPIEHMVSFIADHPFYFLLLDSTCTSILFLGQLQNPQL